jgi:hypothetical protein
VARKLLKTNDSAWLFERDRTRRNDDRAVPFRAPKTIFNGRIHPPRRFATQHDPIERMKAAAKAADGSLNDVFLAVCGGAVRRYLLEHDALPTEDLVVNGQALNITGVSYAGECNIGYTGCRDSIPNLQRIAVYSSEELESLDDGLGI